MSTANRDSTLIVLPSGQSAGTNGLRCFQSLGVNVLRLLFTYIDAKTFMRFTSTARWLYHFEEYEVPGASHCSGWTVRMDVAEAFRQRLLRAGQSRRPLETQYIVEEEFVDVLHAEAVNGRLTCLSQYGEKVTLWEVVAGRGRLVAALASVPALLDFAVCDEGFAALGPANLAVHWTDWKQHVSYEEKKHCTHHFPTPESDGAVRILASSRFVAVLRGACVAVFNRDLQVMRTCDLPDRSSWDFCSRIVHVPSAAAASFIVVSATQAVRVNAITGDCNSAAFEEFLQIVKADVITVPLGASERHFLIVLGVRETARVLLANRSQLRSDVHDFTASQRLLTVLTMKRTLHLYAATASGVSELKTLAGTMPLTHSLVTHTAKRYVVVDHNVCASSGPDFLKIYSEDGEILHCETTGLCVSKLIALRKFIVLAGTGVYPQHKVIAVVNYYEYQRTSDEVASADIRQRVQEEQRRHQPTWTEEQRQKWYKQRKTAKKEETEKKRLVKRQ